MPDQKILDANGYHFYQLPMHQDYKDGKDLIVKVLRQDLESDPDIYISKVIDLVSLAYPFIFRLTRDPRQALTANGHAPFMDKTRARSTTETSLKMISFTSESYAADLFAIMRSKPC